ncbi:MAG: hypothetical protein ABSG90_11775 [Dehalococcoidia bacterium]|jgi:hypothetical protein
MFCPLKFSQYPPSRSPALTDSPQCEKEKCAWWEKWGEKPEHESCAILSIAKTLSDFQNDGVVMKNQY